MKPVFALTNSKIKKLENLFPAEDNSYFLHREITLEYENTENPSSLKQLEIH